MIIKSGFMEWIIKWRCLFLGFYGHECWFLNSFCLRILFFLLCDDDAIFIMRGSQGIENLFYKDLNQCFSISNNFVSGRFF